MMTKPTTPPPDKDAEIALLRMRVHAAETALYAFETFVREDLLEKFVQPVVKQMHAIAQQYPIGDDTPAGAKQLALNAVRSSMPQYKDATDEELIALFFKEPRK